MAIGRAAPLPQPGLFGVMVGNRGCGQGEEGHTRLKSRLGPLPAGLPNTPGRLQREVMGLAFSVGERLCIHPIWVKVP